MSRPSISINKLTDTLSLSERHPTADYRGKYWLWDDTRKMNLAMGANTEIDALVMVITYYQKSLSTVEKDYKELRSKVDSFVTFVVEEI